MKKRINLLSEKMIATYRRICPKKYMTDRTSKQVKELSSLSPGCDVNTLINEYYIKKVTNSILLVLFGILISILAVVGSYADNAIIDGNKLERRDAGAGDYKLVLSAQSNEHDYENVDINVEERRLTQEEYDEMIASVTAYIEGRILGDNASFDHIDSRMNLITAVDNYPCKIRWEVSNYLLLKNSGEFGDLAADEDGEEIVLRAIIEYKDLEYTKEYRGKIFPHRMTDDEIYEAQLMSAISSENEATSEREYFLLPKAVGESELTWNEKKEPIIVIVFIGTVIAVIATWIGADADLNQKYITRNQELLTDYSEVVSKFQLLLSSGLTIRGTMEKMVRDYKRHIQKGGARKNVYEEMLLCVRKMQDGMGETACYEYFGKRCGLPCYKKLSSLLIQNYKKGNEGLVIALTKEATIAFEERKATSRKMGEEAQTKLLFPMIIMLMIVMIIIMVPAYFSFGI